MHIERILLLADVIEKQPHTQFHARSGFNMRTYTHSCGSPSCIAGWAAELFTENIEGSIFANAQAALDITDRQASNLFMVDEIPWSDITPAHAARTLRNLAATGEVQW
jgi:hypothetical protein